MRICNSQCIIFIVCVMSMCKFTVHGNLYRVLNLALDIGAHTSGRFNGQSRLQTTVAVKFAVFANFLE